MQELAWLANGRPFGERPDLNYVFVVELLNKRIESFISSFVCYGKRFVVIARHLLK
jgi:hypothetical protein